MEDGARLPRIGIEREAQTFDDDLAELDDAFFEGFNIGVLIVTGGAGQEIALYRVADLSQEGVERDNADLLDLRSKRSRHLHALTAPASKGEVGPELADGRQAQSAGDQLTFSGLGDN